MTAYVAVRHAVLSLVGLLALLVGGCHDPLQPPHIVPELHNWPETYHGTPGLRLHVFQTGSMTLSSRLVYEGGSVFGQTQLDVLVFAIQHPHRGLILVGTGLNRALADSVADGPQTYLETPLSVLGRARLSAGQDIVAQLQAARLPADETTHIILPDLRPDHAGELEHFSGATAVVTSAEHAAAIGQTGLGAYLPKEYDQVAQWQFIDFGQAEPLGLLPAAQDLFGDGSVILLDASGMTAGGLAVLVRLPTRPVLLCGNLAWTRDQYRYTRLPGLAFDRDAWWDKIWRLKKWTQLAPELTVLPDHDWQAVEAGITADMRLHIFEAVPPSASGLSFPRMSFPQSRNSLYCNR